MVAQVGEELRFSLGPSASTAELAAFFKGLEAGAGAGAGGLPIRSYAVSDSTLEHIFIKICGSSEADKFLQSGSFLSLWLSVLVGRGRICEAASAARPCECGCPASWGRSPF